MLELLPSQVLLHLCDASWPIVSVGRIHKSHSFALDQLEFVYLGLCLSLGSHTVDEYSSVGLTIAV
ncbi:hypothetical protein DPMN_100661 [Dreissena polymorpha]|uniref:Uncharacterized protein n=1 Tax=Dreissena polymorpha TaxID=45954 RepID=A0A9D4LIK4_DREPO|nr:hypothetical protein DPMN_100661 [Dreissena polymorpha]